MKSLLLVEDDPGLGILYTRYANRDFPECEVTICHILEELSATLDKLKIDEGFDVALCDVSVFRSDENLGTQLVTRLQKETELGFMSASPDTSQQYVSGIEAPQVYDKSKLQ